MARHQGQREPVGGSALASAANWVGTVAVIAVLIGIARRGALVGQFGLWDGVALIVCLVWLKGAAGRLLGVR